MKRITVTLPDSLAQVLKREARRRGASVVESNAGAFKGYGPALIAEELREAAEQAIADEVVARSGR